MLEVPLRKSNFLQLFWGCEDAAPPISRGCVATTTESFRPLLVFYPGHLSSSCLDKLIECMTDQVECGYLSWTN